MAAGKTWQHGGAAGPVHGAFSGPYEGEIVELFGKTPSGGVRLMYDARIAITNATRDFCRNGGKNCRVTWSSEDLGQVRGPKLWRSTLWPWRLLIRTAEDHLHQPTAICADAGIGCAPSLAVIQWEGVPFKGRRCQIGFADTS